MAMKVLSNYERILDGWKLGCGHRIVWFDRAFTPTLHQPDPTEVENWKAWRAYASVYGTETFGPS